MPNIRDVAKRAGVSITTVSRIMNHDESYKTKEQTRKKVWQAATELGYVLPDRTPRISIDSTGRATKRIGCIVNANFDKFIDPYYQSALDGVQQHLRERDMELAAVFDGKHMGQPELQQAVLHAGLNALIIMSYDMLSRTFYAALGRTVPILVCITDMTSWDNHDLVTYDHFLAVEQIMEHLFARGHERIAYIGGASAVDRKEIWRDPRCRAYMDMMRAHNLDTYPEWMVDCQWSRKQCYAATQALATAPHRPTAILAGSDNMAVMALRALYDLRLHVPSDMAVAGLSDLEFTRYTTPPLTTIHVPAREIGAQAAELVIQRLNGDITMKKHVLFPTSLVVREST